MVHNRDLVGFARSPGLAFYPLGIDILTYKNYKNLQEFLELVLVLEDTNFPGKSVLYVL